MVLTVECTSSSQYFESLRGYVLSPLPAALAALERERKEIAAERRSFERFVDRVEEVECERPQWRRADRFDGSRSRKFEAVRDAYRETVMSVAHYDEVYDNTLRADLASEFGAELAAVVGPDTEGPFTDRARNLVVAAAENSIRQRTTVLEQLATEQQSVETAREELAELVEGLDGAHIPQWYAETFLDRIDDLAADRQATIGRCRTPGFTDGHQFCQYLYDDEEWTYPVLTALGRLRRTVVVPEP